MHFFGRAVRLDKHTLPCCCAQLCSSPLRSSGSLRSKVNALTMARPAISCHAGSPKLCFSPLEREEDDEKKGYKMKKMCVLGVVTQGIYRDPGLDGVQEGKKDISGV